MVSFSFLGRRGVELTWRTVYFFRWILHNYSTPYALQILKNTIPALKPGARIIINDHCLREAGAENPWDEIVMRRMDVVMLALLNAQERTEEEYRELFRAASENFVFLVSFSASFWCFRSNSLPGSHSSKGMPHEHHRGGLAAQGGGRDAHHQWREYA